MIKGYEKYKNDPAGYLKALREDLRTKYAIAQAKDDGKRIGMKEGIREGKEKTLLDSINNLMETMNLTAKQAMDALKIPPNEQSKYQHMI